VETASEGIAVLDRNYKFTYVNSLFAGMLGCTPEEIIGTDAEDIIFEEDLDDHRKRRSSRASGKSEIYERRLRRKDGSPLWALISAAPVTDDNGEFDGSFFMVTDITDQKIAEEALGEKEEQLRQAQKLEAVGLLAGGVAHDFNNILTVMSGYCEFVRGALRDGDPLAADVDQIVRGVERATSLTRQLLAFSRKQTLQTKVLDLNEVVRGLEKMLKRLIGEDIELVTDLAADLRPVKADPGQMEQIIMNLAVNARDAMPEGGRLTIVTAHVDFDEEYIKTHISIDPGPHAMLSVTDTGAGMDTETRDRIFEPFFTTKGLGKGTGLGLSTVYGIVKQHGGDIWAYSEPGMGTTIKVYLPCTVADTAVEHKKEADIRPAADGEKILLVEDEDILRELMEKTLKKYKYRVTVAANGGEALLAVEEKGLRPDLLITDIIMPGMNGKVLADRLRKVMPSLKVLFMSGYTDDHIVHHGVLDPDTPFIQKPFSIGALAGMVRKVLEG
jgi:PAS domain S-box-containing protein